MLRSLLVTILLLMAGSVAEALKPRPMFKGPKLPISETVHLRVGVGCAQPEPRLLKVDGVAAKEKYARHAPLGSGGGGVLVKPGLHSVLLQCGDAAPVELEFNASGGEMITVGCFSDNPALIDFQRKDPYVWQPQGDAPFAVLVYEDPVIGSKDGAIISKLIGTR